MLYLWASLPNSMLNYLMLVIWNHPWWECLHHGNWQMLQTIFSPESQLLKLISTSLTTQTLLCISFFLLLLLLFSSSFHRLCSLSNHASKGVVSSSALKLPALQFSQQYWNLGQENIFLLILYCTSHSQILLVPGPSKISHIKISWAFVSQIIKT